jgi:hypothetical protein
MSVSHAKDEARKASQLDQIHTRLLDLADTFEKHAARLEGLTDKLVGAPKNVEGKALLKEAGVGGLVSDLTDQVDRLSRLSDRIYEVGSRLDGAI